MLIILRVCARLCVCVWEGCLCVRNSRWATSVIPYCICFSKPNYKRGFTPLPDVWICISSVHDAKTFSKALWWRHKWVHKERGDILCHCAAALPSSSVHGAVKYKLVWLLLLLFVRLLCADVLGLFRWKSLIMPSLPAAAAGAEQIRNV